MVENVTGLLVLQQTVISALHYYIYTTITLLVGIAINAPILTKVKGDWDRAARQVDKLRES